MNQLNTQGTAKCFPSCHKPLLKVAVCVCGTSFTLPDAAANQKNDQDKDNWDNNKKESEH